MSNEVIYIKGQASGYFKPQAKNELDFFSFFKIDFRTVDIRNSEIIESFSIDEIKIDPYCEPISKLNSVNVYLNDTEFIQEEVAEIIFTEFLISDVFYVGIEKYVKYSATVYYEVDKSRSKSNSKSQDKQNITDDFDAKNSTFIPKFLKDKFNIKDNSQLIVGLFFILFVSSIVFVFLNFLFGYSFIGFVISIIFFLKFGAGILENRFPKLNNYLGFQESYGNILGWILLVMGCYYLYFSFFTFSTYLLLAFGFSLIFITRLNPILKRIGKASLIISIILFFGFYIPLFNNDNLKPKKSEKIVETEKPEKREVKPKKVKEKVKIDPPKISYISHSLDWDDNYQNHYTGNFKVREDYFELSRKQRNLIRPIGENFSAQFTYIYQKILSQNKGYLDLTVGAYREIGRKNRLNDKMFADMIVTSVQSIPYTLVHEYTHSRANTIYKGFIEEYHKTGGPCLPEIKFGLQTPTEFMANLKGDCDTKTIFLYYILSKLGYSVAVLGSEHYSHAILGISGNYSGQHKKYEGLNYYAWETTSTGFVPGVLSPDCSNMRYWNVLLENSELITNK